MQNKKKKNRVSELKLFLSRGEKAIYRIKNGRNVLTIV